MDALAAILARRPYRDDPLVRVMPARISGDKAIERLNG
jgi:hypothetical protein